MPGALRFANSMGLIPANDEQIDLTPEICTTPRVEHMVT